MTMGENMIPVMNKVENFEDNHLCFSYWQRDWNSILLNRCLKRQFAKMSLCIFWEHVLLPKQIPNSRMRITSLIISLV